MLAGCVASSSYYTADEPSMATLYKGCHSFGSTLNPIRADDRIRPMFFAGIKNHTTVQFEFEFFLGSGATFVLLDNNIKVILPTGEELSLPIRRAPGGVSYMTAIENGVPITAPAKQGTGGWGPIILLADLVVDKQLPTKLVFVTPRFRVNDVIYPPRPMPLHLDSRSGLDLCEG